MDLATLVLRYRAALENKYASRLLPGHRRALDAIARCRTPDAGQVLARCSSCKKLQWHPCSCGHRSCPKCQNHDATRWLERQRNKLLPVEYFLVTFTLPAELRALAWNNQRKVYDAMFVAATQTLVSFGHNPKHLGASIGCTAVLQTHSRRLTFHPHLHLVTPAGGVHRSTRLWKRGNGKYLFNAKAMAQVFRGKLFHELHRRKLQTPTKVSKQWVVDCRNVGRGEKALEYLARYLYRGVIAEKDILDDRNGSVTFRYTDGRSKAVCTETLNGEEFLWRVLQHVLPRRFHRVRDYGLLHHTAANTRRLIQILLRVTIRPAPPIKRPRFRCSNCGGPMQNLAVYRHRPPDQRKPRLAQRPEVVPT